jgi:hypothetical protein
VRRDFLQRFRVTIDKRRRECASSLLLLEDAAPFHLEADLRGPGEPSRKRADPKGAFRVVIIEHGRAESERVASSEMQLHTVRAQGSPKIGPFGAMCGL